MKRIELSSGSFALINDEDFDLVNQHKWAEIRSGQNTYALTKCGGKTILMHRLIMGEPKGLTVDHINGDGLDNQKGNLRACTQKENLWNQRKRGTLSRFKGVNYRKDAKRNPWHAKITIDGRLKHLGSFATEVEAAKAYDSAAMTHRGQNAALNFLDPIREYQACHPLARPVVRGTEEGEAYLAAWVRSLDRPKRVG